MLNKIFLMIIPFALTACGSSPKTDFYTLSAENEASVALVEKQDAIAIGVWKVKLPPLLDRAGIVTRKSQYKLEVADFSKWAGGLEHNFTQLVASELSKNLSSNKVVTSPWSSYRKNQYQVKIHVEQFDGVLGKEVVLKGAWSLLDAKGNKELSRYAFNYREAMDEDNSYDALVAIMSKSVVKLSGAIASVIRKQE